MKSQRRALTGLALLGVSSIVGACFPARLFPILNSHPPAVVGEWVDSAKTQPRDTSLWVLGASGEDESRHIVVQPDGTIAASSRKHYGFWYLDGHVSDLANRSLCFSKRPGRSAPTCLAFDLDTVATQLGVRRRLIVHGYQKQHTTTTRVLIARAP